MLDKKIICYVLLLQIFVGAAHGATIYKCKGKDKKIYFSDRKCEATQNQTVINLKSSGTKQDISMKERRKRQLNTLENFEKERKENEEQRRKEKAELKANRLARCSIEKMNLENLERRECDSSGSCTIYALTGTDKEGNEVILSEKAKQAEIRRLKSSIEKNC